MRFLFALGATITVIVALLTVSTAGQDAAAAEEEQQDATTLQPVSEEPIKFVHVLNPGEREYLSPNLIGVQNIAMSFLPLSMNFINIIDAYREIVDGVRYEIHLNAFDSKAPTVDFICRLVIIEKPWLRTEWGDKVRELRHSNCTDDADNLTDPAGRSKALNDKYPKSAFFNGGSRNEIGADEMAKIESQILPLSNSLKRSATTSTSTTTTTETPTAATEQSEIEVATHAAEKHGSSSSAENDDEELKPLPVLNEHEMKWLDDFLSVGALSFENSRQESKSQKEATSQIETTAEAATIYSNVDGNQEQQQQELPIEQQQAQLQSQETSEQRLEEAAGAEPQQQQQEQNYEHIRAKRSYDRMTGGTHKLDNKKAEERLQASLDKLASGDGPNYKISKIHSASTQVVSGTLTKIDAELIDESNTKERCQIEIWSQPWLKNGNEVTFNCPNKDTLKVRHSRSVEYAEKKTHKKHNNHNLDKAEHLFNKFQMKFNRHYHNTMERQMRMRIFKQNLKTIEELNRNEMGSAKYGITEFADMTSTEYKLRTGLWQREADKPSKNKPAVVPNVELPKEFDWREKGVVSDVKNQGSCGSCWAFSVTGNIEGIHAVQTGKLEQYSEQELLDCDTTDSACNGGLPDNAYEAIEKIGGLELESEYPYEGRKQQCHFNKSLVHVKLSGAVDLPKNETAMAQWLLANGPISIGINANAMQFYRGGVSHPWHPLCSKTNLDHGVLIVGYGVSDYPMFKKTLPYWIVKNSWGPKWGEQGYYRVYRGDNTCGVSEMATSAILADN